MSSALFQRKLMDSAEVAEYLGLSKHTIRSWVKQRCVPYAKLNGAVRFDRSLIDEWIIKNSQKDINESKAIKKWASSRKEIAMGN